MGKVSAPGARSRAPAWERRCGRSSGRDPSSGPGFMTPERLDLFLRWSVGTGETHGAESIRCPGSKSGSQSQSGFRLRLRPRFRAWRIPIELATWLMRFA